MARQYDRQALAVLLGGVGLVAALQWRELELHLADLLFAGQGMAWRLRHAPLFTGLLHARAQQASKLLYLVTAVATAVVRPMRRFRHWRRRLNYALTAMTACYLIVIAGKALLPLPCPWDLIRYGGHLPSGGWLQWQAGDVAVKGCFPSGHAAGGYVLFAWYFVARDAGWLHARVLLFVVGLIGVGLGLVQQLRGAHFLSHDVATAALCWAVCAALAGRMLSPPVAAGGVHR